MTTEEAIRKLELVTTFWGDEKTVTATAIIKAALAAATARAERAEKDRRTLLDMIQADREAHAREGIRWEELLDEHARLLRYAASLPANLDAPAPTDTQGRG